MISEIRADFNRHFDEKNYEKMIEDIQAEYPNQLEFRIAETPVFLDKSLKNKLEEAAYEIVGQLENPAIVDKLKQAIPKEHFVPGKMTDCEMFSLDFGICEGEHGELIPQLIELQGFPTLFYFQYLEANAYRKAFNIEESWTNYFNDFSDAQYLKMLSDLILHGYSKEEVILLDIEPETQKTRIDFAVMQQHIGVFSKSISELYEENGNVYYLNDDGSKQYVKRIFNRMIFDDFDANKSKLSRYLDITQPLNVEWLPHPNWFYEWSKYCLPFLQSKYAPQTNFLNALKEIPTDLENYVLKPLFSFAGQGVIIDVSKEDIEKIATPEHWILQKKAKYAPIIKTQDQDAMFEIRLMFFRIPGQDKPVLINNLVRISKGKMVGVRYNMDKTWVGSSIAFFQKD
ncbi:hypothetical protein [Rhizosphaericola mali]|uniref:Circularly permuted type 2 ATP-grasp protein n=1 Tax=Rhizosphaericola mali TaxID=2545455 RepID=A0A5P2G8N2_9BACT|nr:hypothetical protein [Rhizosphaericola mali]QES90659.1 hypothetical protein E0W69_019035 [Rhizosphaericola mali]